MVFSVIQGSEDPPSPFGLSIWILYIVIVIYIVLGSTY